MDEVPLYSMKPALTIRWWVEKMVPDAVARTTGIQSRASKQYLYTLNLGALMPEAATLEPFCLRRQPWSPFA